MIAHSVSDCRQGQNDLYISETLYVLFEPFFFQRISF